MSRVRFLVVLLFATAACDPPGPPPPSPRPSSSVVVGPASVRPTASASAPSGPAETGARDAREKAALALLEGRVDPLHYPEVMTDPGDAFDRQLRGRLTTRDAKGPSIKLVDKKITGKLEDEAVARAIRQRFGQFRICYEARLADAPTLKGKLTAKLVVSPEGTVSSAAMTGGDLKDADLKTCIQKALLSASFPKVEGGAAVVEVGVSFER